MAKWGCAYPVKQDPCNTQTCWMPGRLHAWPVRPAPAGAAAAPGAPMQECPGIRCVSWGRRTSQCGVPDVQAPAGGGARLQEQVQARQRVQAALHLLRDQLREVRRQRVQPCAHNQPGLAGARHSLCQPRADQPHGKRLTKPAARARRRCLPRRSAGPPLALGMLRGAGAPQASPADLISPTQACPSQADRRQARTR